jgi:hypothetical protein
MHVLTMVVSYQETNIITLKYDKAYIVITDSSHTIMKLTY